ncbi:MAG TPA: hypothetical protein VFU27_09365 [Terriglobales bacterium]|nr:hypothetical protein [Terriglobales bacterium]
MKSKKAAFTASTTTSSQKANSVMFSKSKRTTIASGSFTGVPEVLPWQNIWGG